MQSRIILHGINSEKMQYNLLYHKIKITDKFLPNKDIYLYGIRLMSMKKDGYYLVTHFKTIADQVIV
ncbi:surfeit locus protein 1 (surf1) [Rickettsia typhi str. B9991CWPP]|uniref:Surfeit locus protein 1 (Surf1) n=1 Tax=Rickettsia typhi str. TH1527 TaxID=1003201 RepID=A0ABN4AE00_RICTP|nr:surfeit locus protein 1 (surf1) [Rickettsia typhi str. TH1527]AFE55393.1 surfeit locus protein 1 (surf1) [Rickettsia typhi str. B9991CWPP]